MDKSISAKSVAKNLGLFLKIVTSVKTYNSYNIIYNTPIESEEYCRRVVVLTKYMELEEVYDDNPAEEIDDVIIKDGSAWLKTYPLLTKPSNIDLDAICISELDFNRIQNELCK